MSPATRSAPPPAPQVPYGTNPVQVGNLHLPTGPGPFPVVVLVHGGFWRSGWDRTLMTPLARDLAERGIAAWNIEYRRVGDEGGAWPGTFLDAAAALDHLAVLDCVDLDRIVTCGHSAGGHLALWLAGRDRLEPGDPGSKPRVRVRAVVAQAPVADFAVAWESFAREQLAALLGGAPEDVPQRYRCADPVRLAPLGVSSLLVHGGADNVVPPQQSRAFARASEGQAELVEFEDADHFDVIDPRHAAWQTVLNRLPLLFG